ncbi:MAG: hypothetical protein U0R71_01020 [Solirubrobacterales bacterium]
MSPGTPYSREHLLAIFDRAVSDRDVDRAFQAGRAAAPLPLDRALRLTVLLGHLGDRRYPIAARRFVARFAVEAEPTLKQVSKVADALDCIGITDELPMLREGADRALEDLERQLRA